MLLSYMAMPGIPRKASDVLLSIDKQIELITSAVCAYYGVRTDSIKARNRVASDARHVTIYLINEIVPIGITAVSRKLGLDHTTGCWAVGKVKDLIFSDPVFRLRLHAMRKQIEKDFNTYKNFLVESKKQLLS